MIRTVTPLLLASALFAQEQPSDQQPEKPVVMDPAKYQRALPLTPEQTIAAIELPPGYRLELVASEPMIREPAVVAWDGNGRMYVAEMRTYMQDIDGTDELVPTSRISLLDDTDGDGRMDKHTVFVDELLLPRMILPLQDGIVVRETNTLDLYRYRDTDGDGRADERTLMFEGGKRGGNLEHQPSGLDWNIDNNLYVTYTNKRYRVEGDKIVAEGLPSGGGQWGITHDDWGQCYYSIAGGEVVATQFQQNLQYGKLDLPGQLAEGFHECWPIDDIPDVQGGLRRVREDGSLNHFTACCGQAVYRGDRLPKELRGNLFVPEPVGRLIRRAVVTDVGGMNVLSNPHGKGEFLRTKDANFRPINMYTAPDGTLYIVDMYRGIIQEGNWVREGSYLRKVVQEYGLDKHVGRGRIYRLVHEDHEPGPRPRMLDESCAELVAHLAHPNGWWRDNAQKLLVLRGDKSVEPALRKMMRAHESPLARLHAMYTLDGLHLLSDADVIERMADTDPRMRVAAVHAAERFLGKKLFANVAAEIATLGADQDPRVALQVLRTALYTQMPDYELLVEAIVKARPDNVAIEATARKHFERLAREKAEAEERARIEKENKALAEAMERGAKSYQALCFTCHGSDGKGMPVLGMEGAFQAPTLIGSPRVLGSTERLGRIVLNGLMGPVDGKNYVGVMAPLALQTDEYLADVLSYVRNSWGNKASRVTKEEIAKLREETKGRLMPWTLEELKKYDPTLKSRVSWKLSASDNDHGVNGCIDGDDGTRWDTGHKQQGKEWFVIELPEVVRIEAIDLDTRGSPRDFPKRYEIRVSADGKDWGDPIATGKGKQQDSIVKFAPVAARFVKISQTGKTKNWYWSIHELHLYGDGNPLPK